MASSKKKSKTPPSPTEPVVPSRSGASTGEILSWCGFTAILIACMGYVLFHAFLIDRVTVRLCKELDGPNAKSPRTEPEITHPAPANFPNARPATSPFAPRTAAAPRAKRKS